MQTMRDNTFLYIFRFFRKGLNEPKVIKIWLDILRKIPKKAMISNSTSFVHVHTDTEC